MRRILAIVLAVAVVLAAAGLGFAAGGSGIAGLFGDKMMRAEVVWQDNSVFDLYRGRLVAVAPDSVTVREADGRVDTVPVNTSTRITLGNAVVSVTSLRRGMRATVVRPSNGTATIVQVQRK